MDCPRCNVEMTLLEREDVSLQRCTECEGSWLDAADLNRILVHHSLPVLERIGGKALLEEIAATCPECTVDLTVVEGSQKEALRYETCESCGGVWLEMDEEADGEDYAAVEAAIVRHFKRF